MFHYIFIFITFCNLFQIVFSLKHSPFRGVFCFHGNVNRILFTASESLVTGQLVQLTSEFLKEGLLPHPIKGQTAGH